MRTWWAGLNLSTRLAASYLGLMVVVLGLLVVFLYAGFQWQSRTAELANLRDLSARVRVDVDQRLVGGASPSEVAQAVADSDRGGGDLWVSLVASDGRVIAHSSGPESIVQTVPEAGLQALAGGAPEYLVIIANQDPAVALSLAPLDTSPPGTDGPRYAQIATRPTPPTDGRILLPLLATGFTGSLLLALVVGPRISGRGLRPLREMAVVSRRLAAGDLSARVPQPRTRDEVGALARAFNEMAKQLQAVFATQQAFVADASHELRTPLTALGGQLDVLRGLISGRSEEADQLIDSMRRDITRMSRLAEDLLILARLDAQGADALQLQKVDLTAVARDVYEQTRALPAACDKQVRLEVNGPVIVRGDPYRLHQVLLNLTVNAVQHAPARVGEVVLRVESPQIGVARAIVSDNGLGIEPERVRHLFDRFYRIDTARSRASGGAGLGLAIARAIAEAHAGTIVAGNSPTGGAEFIVSLPAQSH
jgi:two-component system OmpR family sensor kinase